jgi:hypothetical protein
MFSIAHTPPIKGKVVDAQTKKPIKDVNIKVTWDSIFPFWIDPGHPTFKEETYHTNEQGKFEIPRLIRPLFPLTVFYEQQILLYAHAYKAERITIMSPKQSASPEDEKEQAKKYYSKETIIELKPLKTAEEWAENLNSLELWLGYSWERTEEEKKFLEEEEKLYEEVKKKEKESGK